MFALNTTVRKAIKIKTFFMLLAWSIIFLHAVIPHNHINNHALICHLVCHNRNEGLSGFSSNTGSSESYHMFVPAGHNDMVCHFFTHMMFNDNPDKIFTYKSSTPYISIPEKKTIYNPGYWCGREIKIALKLRPLRAPPA